MSKSGIFLLFTAALILGIVSTTVYFKYMQTRETTQKTLNPLPPIDISYRTAILGDGVVAKFANMSDRHLSFKATFSNPTFNASGIFKIEIPPSHWTTFGHMEGWSFSSGDEITLEHNEFRTITTIVP
jgi:hypothetical protein